MNYVIHISTIRICRRYAEDLKKSSCREQPYICLVNVVNMLDFLKDI